MPYFNTKGFDTLRNGQFENLTKLFEDYTKDKFAKANGLLVNRKVHNIFTYHKFLTNLTELKISISENRTEQDLGGYA